MKSQEEMMQLAAQLRLPHGNDGVAVAQMMHDTNIGMTQHAIANM
jgi:hypothetical protein